ncbi:retrovirus-related pol polyprotein from transposon TNT 1-94 [Tanacetum coccineum]|uniref:Retrovirus-related pol polyprotein from transposon TNT 1-94 n=1 Tax=Tanacetum coccineum TaxID=301880 RepID=A0ABQ5EUK8_9ASTR
MAKASPTQAWLWHRRLSHLNFDYITLLSKKDVVTGLPKLTYVKDQLCSSCEMSKAKRSSFKSKAVPSSKGRLNLLHMDLCGPMRVASINGKKYILVIVDDYSRYTWTLFLRSKDETPEVLKDFLTMIQRNLQAQVITVRTDRGTEFLNKTLHAYFKEEALTSNFYPRTPEENGVVQKTEPPVRFVDPDHPEKVTFLRKLCMELKQSSKSLGTINYQPSRCPKAFTKVDLKISLNGGDEILLGFRSTQSPKLVKLDFKETKLHYNVFSRGKSMGVICKLCSSNVERTKLQDYGFNYNKIPLYCDSQSAIAISCNPVQHSRTKHIHTRYHFIKEQVENGIIELYFVRTEYQTDMFTKALPEDRFKYLVRRIGMRCLTPAELEVLTNETA